MEGSVVDLSRYRLERAKDDLKTARDNFNEGSYRASVNRSYYAIFHALRAITALDQFDSGKQIEKVEQLIGALELYLESRWESGNGGSAYSGGREALLKTEK